MSSMIKIGQKILSIVEVAEELENMGPDVGEFSNAMHVFNLEFPFEIAKMSGDGCKCSIRGSSQEITEAEAV